MSNKFKVISDSGAVRQEMMQLMRDFYDHKPVSLKIVHISELRDIGSGQVEFDMETV